MTFNQRFKALREENKLTQEELAKILGVGRSTIAGYETKSKQPHYDLLTKIASYFDVSTDYLLGQTNIKKYNDALLAFNSTENLTDEDLAMVRTLIENLKKKNLK